MINKYPGPCMKCEGHVAAGEETVAKARHSGYPRVYHKQCKGVKVETERGVFYQVAETGESISFYRSAKDQRPGGVAG